MRYTPVESRPENLVDVDTLLDDAPLPSAAPKQPKVKLAKGPGAFNLRANRALPNLASWLLMAVVAVLCIPILAGPLLKFQDHTWIAEMSAALGLGLGSVLLWGATRADRGRLYSNVHVFLFISLGLSLTEWISSELAFAVLGPLLVGYGAGSFVIVIAQVLFFPIKSGSAEPAQGNPGLKSA